LIDKKNSFSWTDHMPQAIKVGTIKPKKVIKNPGQAKFIDAIVEHQSEVMRF
jgi:hypothetical protein